MSKISEIRQDVLDALSGISIPSIHLEKLEAVFEKHLGLEDKDDKPQAQGGAVDTIVQPTRDSPTVSEDAPPTSTEKVVSPEEIAAATPTIEAEPPSGGHPV